MSTMGKSAQETNRSQEFQNNLRLLDGISSWHAWTGGVMLLLSSVSTILLFNITPTVIWGLRGLLAVVSILGAAFLYQQRNRLARLRGSLVAQIDATTRARVEAEKLHGLATVDALTGLYNRRFGETRLKEEIERAEKSREPMSLVAVDFDKFKEINDTYGHAAGDLALKAFSKRLQRTIRACDVPIRVGGDEFLVIFPDCPVDKISEILSRLDSIDFEFGGKKIPVTFSHGIAQFEIADTPEKMKQRADARLYAHKEKRKSAAGARSTHARSDEATEAESNAVNTGEAHSGEGAISSRSGSSEPSETVGGTNLLDMGSLFRRSRRVDCDMPVNIRVHNENKMPVVQEGKTLNVSAHGALLALNKPMEIGQQIRLVNPRTNQEIDCCVRRLVMSTPDGMVQVGVEFTAVAPKFWDIASPPWDWDPAGRPPQRQSTEPAENRAPRIAMDWGNDTYDARSSQPFVDPAWVPGGEGQPARPSPSAKVASGDLWEQLGQDIQEALKDVGKTLPVDQTESKGLSAKGNHKRGRDHRQFALALALAFFAGIAVTLLIVPRKSVAQSSPTPGLDSTHSERVAEAAPAMPSNTNSAVPPVVSSFGTTTGPAGQAALPTELTQLIPDLAGFRQAKTEDFDPAAVEWLRTRGQQGDAQIPADYTGSGESHAYLLRDEDKSWRVLIIADGRVYCDIRYRSVAVAARVPKGYMRSIKWSEPAAPEFDGDGLLIVGSADDPASGVVLSLHGNNVSENHPADYRVIRLSDVVP